MSSTAANSSSIVPEVLKNNNYKIWRAFMKDYLLGEDLWDVIIDSNIAQDDQTKSTTWKQKNGKALHAIKISCGPAFLPQIGFAERASDAWRQLERIQKEREKGRSESLQSVIDIDTYDDKNVHLTYVQEGDLSKLKEIIEKQPAREILRKRVTSYGGTLLHAAIIAQEVKIVELLVSKMDQQGLEIQDDNLYTALDTIAAQIGDEKTALQMAKCIAPKYPHLVTHGKVLTPILIASAHGHKDMTRYLYKVIVDAKKPRARARARDEFEDDTTNIFDSLDPEKGRLHGTILLSQCITAKMFDVASDLVERLPSLVGYQCAFIDPILNLCSVPSAFRSGHRSFQLTECIKSYLCCGRLLPLWKYLGIRVTFEDQKVIHRQAKKILHSICKKLPIKDGDKLEESSVREAMFEAAKNGIVEFINEMAGLNQRLLWLFDDDRRSIFSYAVIYRREKVFNLIYGVPPKVVHDLTTIVDSYDNNMLHLAAAMPAANSSTFNRASGAALQMQRELQWFKEVARICKPSCKDMVNQDGLTPHELFSKSHIEQVKEGEEWMKATAQSSSVVAALIVTVTFAAAFTVPGGNDQNTGFPIFLSKLPFKIFMVSNAISFYSSLTSVLVFLGILMSRYSEEDFLVRLPSKLIIGLASLCFSIATMMATFCCALTIMLKGRLLYVLPIAFLSFIPLFFFLFWSLYPVLSEILMSTFWPRMFDKTTKSSKKRD